MARTISKTIFTLAAALAVVAFTAPAFAEDGDDPDTSRDENTIFSHLHSRGIRAVELGSWGSHIRATVDYAFGAVIGRSA